MKAKFSIKACSKVKMKQLTILLLLFGPFLYSCQTKNPDVGISMKEDVTFLASDDLEGRETGTIGEKKAAAYIIDRFKKIGLKPAGTNGYYQEFKVTPAMNPHEMPKVGEGNDTLAIVGNNVIGMIDNPGNSSVIIGAHYDHLGYGGVSSLYRSDSLQVHNGADDNASGVATMIQLAERLSRGNLPIDIIFIAFTGEEKGLWGSNYFAKNATINLANVSAMINMDMVGRLDEEKALAIHGTGTSPIWEEIINKANKDSLKLVFRASGVGPSDHTSFYLQDIPVLHFFTGQHGDYHKPGDDADKINYAGMVKIVSMIDRIVNEIASTDKLAFTKTKDESSDTPRFTVSLGVVPDYLFGGQGMRIDGISEGKPAQAAGLLKGDVVVKLGNNEVTDMMSYMKALSTFEKGNETVVTVKREDKEITVPIKF